jgi:hypothetical protein
MVFQSSSVDIGVIWYFDPHGILILGSTFIHGILIPLLKTDPPPSMYGKLNPHGILTPLISSQEIGRGVKIPWIEGGSNTMGRGFDIPWVGVYDTGI